MTDYAELIKRLRADEAYHRDVYQQFAHDEDFKRMENVRAAATALEDAMLREAHHD